MITTTIILLTYVALMFYLCWKAKKYQYLLSAVVIWLILGIIGAGIMPNIYGLSHLISLYLVPLYFLVGSLFYFIYDCRLHCNKELIGIESDKNTLLAALTFANFFVHAGYILLIPVIYLIYPPSLKPIFLPALFCQYFLQPVWIIGLQFTLALLIWLHTKANNRKNIILSAAQSLFFCCFISFIAVIKVNYLSFLTLLLKLVQ